jgi:hypothetical protein
MLNLDETPLLVNASAAAASNQVVPRPRDAFRHMFLVTISVLGSVWVEAAVTGAPLRWIAISGILTASGSIAVEGNFTNLRIAWSGNTGTITVDLIKSAEQPSVY